MKQIATAFIAAKRNFGPVLKGKTNPAFKSKYANLEACLDAVDAACLDAGIALYQETFDDATGVTVETVFLHESGETLRCGKLHVPASKQDPQGYGSALTYARRYSLLAACGIAAEDDDGNAASKAAAPVARKPAGPSLQEEAKNLTQAVLNGKAGDAAGYLAGVDQATLDAIWQHIAPEIQDEITANWPAQV